MCSKDKIRIASFDIGKKNFAQYVEETPITTLYELKKEYPKVRPFIKSIKFADKYSEFLNKVFLSGERIHVGVFDLRYNHDSTSLDMETRINLINHLESFEWLWDTCDIFIIEQQFFKTFYKGRRKGGSQANVDAIKLAEIVMTWLIVNYPFKEIMTFGSKFKTDLLQAPKLNDTQRKSWAIIKAQEIYTLRQDLEILTIYLLKKSVYNKRVNTEEKVQKFLCEIQTEQKDIIELAGRVVRDKQKLDDVSDVCLQAQAFKIKCLIA